VWLIDGPALTESKKACACGLNGMRASRASGARLGRTRGSARPREGNENMGCGRETGLLALDWAGHRAGQQGRSGGTGWAQLGRPKGKGGRTGPWGGERGNWAGVLGWFSFSFSSSISFSFLFFFSKLNSNYLNSNEI
jgi:hypothetical protein